MATGKETKTYANANERPNSNRASAMRAT